MFCFEQNSIELEFFRGQVALYDEEVKRLQAKVKEARVQEHALRDALTAAEARETHMRFDFGATWLGESPASIILLF